MVPTIATLPAIHCESRQYSSQQFFAKVNIYCLPHLPAARLPQHTLAVRRLHKNALLRLGAFAVTLRALIVATRALGQRTAYRLANTTVAVARHGPVRALHVGGAAIAVTRPNVARPRRANCHGVTIAAPTGQTQRADFAPREIEAAPLAWLASELGRARHQKQYGANKELTQHSALAFRPSYIAAHLARPQLHTNGLGIYDEKAIDSKGQCRCPQHLHFS